MFDKKTIVDGTNRAVSPVIGVILMVAITVILAAVIGAFVLEIGDQQETAPKTSFDIQEEVDNVNIPSRGAADNAQENLTSVGFTIAGGDTLSVDQTRLSHEGNTSVWARPNGENNHINDAWNSGTPEVLPQPNVCETLGTNDDVELSSGESIHAEFSGGQFRILDYGKDIHPKLPPHGTLTCSGDGWITQQLRTQNRVMQFRDYPAPANEEYTASKMMLEGDDVQVVWTASSGGKTQTLTKYTVQTGWPDNPE
jgi:flagellin-like protein